MADCVLALLYLRKANPIGTAFPNRKKARVMYLDLDLHFSDAVSECFYKSARSDVCAQVLTLSIHHTAPGFYPVHELSALPDTTFESFDPFTLSIPLKQGASSATFRRVWDVVERVKEAYTPDYVVIQCGSDGLAGDPHGIWNWSVGEGCEGDMDWCIGQVIHHWSAKVMLIGGGNTIFTKSRR